MQSLYKFRDEIATGLQPDRGVDKIDLWEDGSNVIFQEGAVQPVPGQFLLLPKPQGAPAVGLVEARFSDGNRNIFVGTLDKIHRWVEGAASATDITRLAGAYTGVEDATATAIATLWSMVSWGDTVLATNGKDEIQRWTLASPTNAVNMSAVSDLAAAYRAQILGKIGPFVLAFNTNSSETLIDWCDVDDPLVWTPAIANAAGQIQARDLGSPIIAAVPFADGYAVYGVNECRYVSFVDAPDYFGIRPLLSGIGAVSKAAVVAVDRLQFGIGTRGIWVHDGTQSQYIDTPDIHDYIYSDINQNQVSKCVAAYSSTEQLVMFFWPSSYSLRLDRGAAYNKRNKTWTKLSYARTSYSPGHVWEASLTGSRTGDVWIHSSTGFAPGGEGAPLVLPATSALTLPGYGKMGYGKGYYGSATPIGGIVG